MDLLGISSLCASAPGAGFGTLGQPPSVQPAQPGAFDLLDTSGAGTPGSSAALFDFSGQTSSDLLTTTTPAPAPAAFDFLNSSSAGLLGASVAPAPAPAEAAPAFDFLSQSSLAQTAAPPISGLPVPAQETAQPAANDFSQFGVQLADPTSTAEAQRAQAQSEAEARRARIAAKRAASTAGSQQLGIHSNTIFGNSQPVTSVTNFESATTALAPQQYRARLSRGASGFGITIAEDSSGNAVATGVHGPAADAGVRENSVFMVRVRLIGVYLQCLECVDLSP